MKELLSLCPEKLHCPVLLENLLLTIWTGLNFDPLKTKPLVRAYFRPHLHTHCTNFDGVRHTHPHTSFCTHTGTRNHTFLQNFFFKYSKASRYAVFGSRKKPCSSKPCFVRFILENSDRHSWKKKKEKIARHCVRVFLLKERKKKKPLKKSWKSGEKREKEKKF